MRHKFLGLAIIAMAAIGSSQAWGGDREIAAQIIERLQENRSTGELKNFTLDMKVDNGVVVFRGNVNDDTQKQLVLKAAEGISGLSSVVDEVTVKTAKVGSVKQAKADPTPKVEAAAGVEASAGDFSLREALAEEARQIMEEENKQAFVKPAVVDEIKVAPETVSPPSVISPPPVMPGEVRPAGAQEELSSRDKQIVSRVVGALSKAQRSGALKGFGVDVKSTDGVVWLQGRAASSAQRTRILQIAESTPGVQRIRNSIRIPAMDVAAVPAPAPAPTPAPPVLRPVTTPASTRLMDPPSPTRQTAGIAAPVRATPAPYRAPAVAQPLRTQPVQATMGTPIVSSPSMGAPVMGTPVPMGGYTGGMGAPRYDAPNLPNYAWPGYAAHPNYAALTYPQQYSPSAWPYIGPFYPYPQVPLGWRKVSLEWDDGWWQLDFTDR